MIRAIVTGSLSCGVRTGKFLDVGREQAENAGLRPFL